MCTWFHTFLILTNTINTCLYLPRFYVPEFASSLSVSVADCSSGEGGADSGNCSLVLRLGSTSLQEGPVTVNCSGISCSAALSSPPWDTWLRVVVESGQDNRTVTFNVVSNYTGDQGNHTHLKHQLSPVIYLFFFLFLILMFFMCVCLSGMQAKKRGP